MKKLFAFCTIVILLLVFTYVIIISNHSQFDLAEPLYTASDFESIEMSITEFTAASRSSFIIVTIINNSEYYIYPNRYTLEHNIRGQWVQIPSSPFTLEGIMPISPSEVRDFRINLSNHPALRQGIYRIRKNLQLSSKGLLPLHPDSEVPPAEPATPEILVRHDMVAEFTWPFSG